MHRMIISLAACTPLSAAIGYTWERVLGALQK
jgi:hypothetical protein